MSRVSEEMEKLMDERAAKAQAELEARQAHEAKLAELVEMLPALRELTASPGPVDENELT